MADRSLSVSMTLSDFERRDARGQLFRRISLITLVPFDPRTTKFGRVTHSSVFLGVSQANENGGSLFPFYLCICYTTRPSIRPCARARSCVSVTMINRRSYYNCGFCPSFVTTIIHEHTTAGGGYQQSLN